MEDDIEMKTDNESMEDFSFNWEFKSNVNPKLLSDMPGERISGLETPHIKYEDFKTIDWAKERTMSRMKGLYFSEIFRESNFKTKLKILLDKCSTWMILLLIGVVGALMAVVVTSGVLYFSDIKEGVCKINPLHNRQVCCWPYNYSIMDSCDKWVTWGQLFGLSPLSKSSFAVNYISYIFFSILFAMSSGFVVKEIAPYACGGGISEIKTILSGFIMHGFLGFTTLIVKTCALILSVASGLMLGQEGPMVHISCCIANIFSRFFPKFRENEVSKRDILSSSSAAGIAIAFGAPISGVLFSLEETSFYFTVDSLWKSFFVAMIGAFTLSSLIPYSSGNLVLYSIVSARWRIFELPFFAFIGLIGGLYGVLFNKMSLFLCKIRKKTFLKNYPLIEIFVVALITAVSCFPYEISRMSNHHIITYMFSNCIYREGPHGHPICVQVLEKFQDLNPYPASGAPSIILQEMKEVAYALGIKSILIIFTFGIKIPAGIFVPSITLGSLFGRLIGLTVEFLYLKYPHLSIFRNTCKASNQRCIYPSLYSVVGAAAVLGGFTQMTVCVVIILVEITGSLDQILPLILTVMTAKWVSSALLKEGLYEELSNLSNYPYLTNKEEICLPHSVKNGLDLTFKGPIISLPLDGISLSSLNKILKENDFSAYPIVTTSNQLHGFVYTNDISSILDENHSSIPPHEYDNTFVYFSPSISSIISENHRITNAICLKHIMDPSPVSVNPQAPFNVVIYIFQKIGIHHLYVVDKGILLGIITRKDAIFQLRHFLYE